MTDEEMAKQFADRYTHYEVAKRKDGTEYAKKVSDITIEQAFLAGLKAGRTQWHDINVTEPSKEQLGKKLLIRMEGVIADTDYDYLVYKYTGESITDVPGVLAWKEIEK